MNSQDSHIKKEEVSVGIVIILDKKILLVKHGETAEHVIGVYGTPGGRVDQKETLLQAAIRELKEETGLSTTEKDMHELPKKYVADIKRKNGETVRFHHTVFLCTNFFGILTKTDEVEPGWVNISQITKLNLLPNIEDMIKQAEKEESS